MSIAGSPHTRTGAGHRLDPGRADAGSPPGIPVGQAAALPAGQVLDQVGSSVGGLDAEEAA